MAAEPAGARQLAFAWRCWRSWRLERAIWKTKCSSSKRQTKTSSVTKGFCKQNVQLVLGAVPRGDGKRIHIKVQLYNTEMQNRSMFSSQKSPALECQRGTSNNVHQIYSRSERCGNLHALQGAEKDSKAGRESPPVCETGCRNPCKKIDRKKKLMSPPQKAEFCVQRDKR